MAQVIVYNPTSMHAGGANVSPRNKLALDLLFTAGHDLFSGDDTIERFGVEIDRRGEHVRSYSDAWKEVWAAWMERHPAGFDALGRAVAPNTTEHLRRIET